MSDYQNSDRYLPTDTEPMPIQDQLKSLIDRGAPAKGVFQRSLAAIERKDAALRMAIDYLTEEPMTYEQATGRANDVFEALVAALKE